MEANSYVLANSVMDRNWLKKVIGNIRLRKLEISTDIL